MVVNELRAGAPKKSCTGAHASCAAKGESDCAAATTLDCVWAATTWVKAPSTAVAPSGPTEVTLSIVSDTQLGVTWKPPLVDGGQAVTKYLIEWDTDWKFTKSTFAGPTSNKMSTVVLHSEVEAATATSIAAQSYLIEDLSAGTVYFVRVSAYNDESNFFGTERMRGYSPAVIAQGTVVRSIAPYLTTFAAQPTLVATQETKFSLTTAVQAPFKPDTARMEISRVNNADQIDVWHTAPTMNSIGFKKADYAASTAGDGGGTISHIRYEWSTTSSYLTSTSFDAYNSMSGANYLPCNTPGPCAFPLGAEVQAISVYSSTSTSLDTSCGTTHGAGNKCQFQIAFGAFSEEACVVGACATNLDTTTNVLTVNEDIKAKLPTGAQFMVDKHGAAPCTFTVANTQATATEVTVLAGHGCRIGAGA
jgi:hypothetical protein